MKFNKKRQLRKFAYRSLKAEQNLNKRFGNGSNKTISILFKIIDKTK